jgi:hypothetical protein
VREDLTFGVDLVLSYCRHQQSMWRPHSRATAKFIKLRSIIPFKLSATFRALAPTASFLGSRCFAFGQKRETLRDWFLASEPERWRRFSPDKVRKVIKTAGSEVPISKILYSWLCGVGVHVNPEIMPQTHNKEKQVHLGAVFQHDGHTRAIANLGWCLCVTFGIIARTADVDAIPKEAMKKAWDKLGEALQNHPAELSPAIPNRST